MKLLIILLLACSCTSKEDTIPKSEKHCYFYGDIELCYSKDDNGIKLEKYENDELIYSEYL